MDFVPLQCIVLHSHPFNVHITGFSLFTQHLRLHSPTLSSRCKSARAQSTLCFAILFFRFTTDCRQLSCRCIKDVNSQRNTSYLLKRNRAMIYAPKEKKRKEETLCSDFLYSIEIWYEELQLKSLCAALFLGHSHDIFSFSHVGEWEKGLRLQYNRKKTFLFSPLKDP